MNGIIRLLITLLGLINCSVIYGNILIPSSLIWAGLSNPFTWYLIIFGFFSEFICMKLLAHKASWSQIIGATVAMNIGSTVTGIVAFLVFDFMFWYIVNSVACFLRSLAYFQLCVAVVYGMLFFIVILTLNVFIEAIIALWYFPQLDRNKLLKWLFLVNFITLVVGLGGLGYEMVTGRIQDKTRAELYTAMQQEDIRRLS
jgi:hypothetical protein